MTITKLNPAASAETAALSSSPPLRRVNRRPLTPSKEIVENSDKKQYTDYVKFEEKFASVLSEIDGLTPEAVSRLADDFAKRAFAAIEEAKRPNPGPIPENPIRYGDRKTQTERPELATMNPVEFLRAVWGPWIDAGTVYQDDITKRDDTLLSNIRSYCQRMKLVAKDVLPLPKHVRTEVVAEIADKSNIYRAMKALERRQYARNSKSL